ERGFEQRRVGIDTAIAATGRDIDKGVRIDLPVEACRVTDLGAIGFDDADTVVRVVEARNRFTLLHAEIFIGIVDVCTAAGAHLVPALAHAEVQLEAIDGPVGEIEADLAEDRAVGIFDMRCNRSGGYAKRREGSKRAALR